MSRSNQPSRIAEGHRRLQSVRSIECTNDESTDGDNVNTEFEPVIHNRKSKKRRYLSQAANDYVEPQSESSISCRPPAVGDTLWSRVVDSHQPLRPNENGNYAITRGTERPRKKTLKIVGRSKPSNEHLSSSKVLKAAKPYVKKIVFAVYNVDNDESVESLEEFVEEVCDEKPLSCFKVHSNNSSSSTYRVCIDAENRDKFLNAERWYSGIVIRPWKFKTKEARTGAQNPASAGGVIAKDPAAESSSANRTLDNPLEACRMEADDVSHSPVKPV